LHQALCRQAGEHSSERRTRRPRPTRAQGHIMRVRACSHTHDLHIKTHKRHGKQPDVARGGGAGGAGRMRLADSPCASSRPPQAAAAAQASDHPSERAEWSTSPKGTPPLARRLPLGPSGAESHIHAARVFARRAPQLEGVAALGSPALLSRHAAHARIPRHKRASKAIHKQAERSELTDYRLGTQTTPYSPPHPRASEGGSS